MDSFGRKFIIITCGDSHDPFEKLVIKNFIKGIFIDYKLIDIDLARRRPSHDFETPRYETDKYSIISGISLNGVSTGEDIVIHVDNISYNDLYYTQMQNVYRPSHGEYVWQKKYGQQLPPGGGRLSARETVTRVIAGAFAKMILNKYVADNNLPMISFTSWVYSIGNIMNDNYSVDITSEMSEYLRQIKTEGDSIGGSVRCVIKNVPAGIGEPVFNKLHAYLAYAMMSIPGARAFEIGRGVEAGKMKGSQHNDPYKFDVFKNEIVPAKNDAGGIIGGISTGEDIVLTVHFKPISSIAKKQETVDIAGNTVYLEIKGAHDVCCVPRAVVIVEAMAAIVLADMIS